MTEDKSHEIFVFPKWANLLQPAAAVALAGGAVYVAVLVMFGFSPHTTDVGYAPEQPVPYSHALHVGQLGIDCRYCHNTVEVAAKAAIPPTQTCMNCHHNVRAGSEKLIPVLSSNADRHAGAVGAGARPARLRLLQPQHSRQTGRGCVSCHGRVDTMEVVYQAEVLSMGWCLSCHRNPEPHLRPAERVTQLDWVPEEGQEALGRRLRQSLGINPPTTCNGCHR